MMKFCHRCHNMLAEVLAKLLNNASITISETVTEETENLSEASKQFLVCGSLTNALEVLDDEYIKSLQHLDPHTVDYVNRLRDESNVYNLLCAAQRYLDQRALVHEAARIKMRRVEHIYFKVSMLIACTAS